MAVIVTGDEVALWAVIVAPSTETSSGALELHSTFALGMLLSVSVSWSPSSSSAVCCDIVNGMTVTTLGAETVPFWSISAVMFAVPGATAVTIPFWSTVAIALSLDDQPTATLPEARLSVSLSPRLSVTVAGVIASRVSVIVTVHVAVKFSLSPLSSVAVIVATPKPTASTIPSSDTVATSLSLELHTTSIGISCGCAVATSSIWLLSSRFKLTSVSFSSIPSTSRFSTTMVTESELPSGVFAVITADPCLRAVTTPSSSTVAIVLAFVLHLISSVLSGITSAISSNVSPTNIDISASSGCIVTMSWCDNVGYEITTVASLSVISVIVTCAALEQ